MKEPLFIAAAVILILISCEHEKPVEEPDPDQTPSPWNGWKIDWLSKISPGETKAFVFNYPISSPLSQGEYSLQFEFPGLSYQVTRDQLYQNNIRIWLGDVVVTKIFSID